MSFLPSPSKRLLVLSLTDFFGWIQLLINLLNRILPAAQDPSRENMASLLAYVREEMGKEKGASLMAHGKEMTVREKGNGHEVP